MSQCRAWVASGTAACRQRRCVQVVSAMEDRSGEVERHPRRSRQKRTKMKENPCIGYCRIYDRYCLYPPFQALEDSDLKELPFLTLLNV